MRALRGPARDGFYAHYVWATDRSSHATCDDGRPGSRYTRDSVDELIVFNVGGAKYRLIATVSYPQEKVYIRYALTHKEYDRGEWKDD
jgi:HigB_toxin, RelE-like toxic component of a toxin-antitoxin system